MTNPWKNLPRPLSVLAPMDDVTDNVFRRVIQDIGRPDLFFTEFTNADGLVSKGAQIVGRKLKFESDQHPIIAQVWGNKPESFLKAAKIVEELGFDGIDINMGCPIREVVKKRAGAGLIGEYSMVDEIVAATLEGAPNIPLSIKTRLGINKNIAEEWCSYLLSKNIVNLTLHGRTASQMSKVPADWDEIAKIVKIRNKIAPNILVVGNGDVKSTLEVKVKADKYGVDGVMIGRGIFDDPWMFERNKKDHNATDYVNLLNKHLDYFLEETTDPVTVKKRYPALKKFFKMYIKDFPGANITRQRLMESSDITEAKNILESVEF